MLRASQVNVCVALLPWAPLWSSTVTWNLYEWASFVVHVRGEPEVGSTRAEA